MALPNSPFAGTNRGPAPQTAKPAGAAQIQARTVRRVIGNNVHSGYRLPFGAGFVKTNLYHVSGVTTAVHTYIYQGRLMQVTIPVKTSPRRGGTVTPIKLAPQTVDGY